MASRPNRRRRDVYRDIVPVAAILLGVVIAAVAVFGSADDAEQAQQAADHAVAGVRGLVGRVERVEHTDRDTARRASYRLCARNRADRAFAQSLTARGSVRPVDVQVLRRVLAPVSAGDRKILFRLLGARSAKERRHQLRELQKPRRLPILDCAPNLRGHGAQIWAPRKQDQFWEAWVRGDLGLDELGVCPNSTVQRKPGQNISGC